MPKQFYLTTAIDYANGRPHIGHAYEKVLTDVIARHHRLLGEQVHFLTGLDEHGQKVQQTAAREEIAPQDFCDRVAEDFQEMCRSLSISNDDYIRTTQPRHKAVVAELLNRLHAKGEIYKARYQGYYSRRQEQFLQEKDRQEDGSWPEEFGEVEEITEENYFFKLSAYQPWLIEHIKENESFIFPRFRAKQVLEFLKEPLNDLCISRPVERLSWGIPLPFDADYVSYVWFDALINYVSAVWDREGGLEAYWPANYHVIGKDILVPPHAVYWPIMLKALELPLPQTLLVHGWWLTRGGKMSKSTGNVINPLDLVDEYGADALRYFLIREMNVGQDSDFTFELFQSRYNADLANDLGNLLSRLMTMTQRNCEGLLPAAHEGGEEEQEVQTLWAETEGSVRKHYDTFQFHLGLEQTFRFVSALNRYAEKRSPWKLAKSEDPEDRKTFETSLATMAEGLRLSAILLLAVLPERSARILKLLGQEVPERWEPAVLEWGSTLEGVRIGEKEILFPKHN